MDIVELIQEKEDRIKQLEVDKAMLKYRVEEILTTVSRNFRFIESLLANQCDAAREIETKCMTLEREIKRLFQEKESIIKELERRTEWWKWGNASGRMTIVMMFIIHFVVNIGGQTHLLLH